MTRDTTPAGSPATRAVDESFAEVRASFDRFCCGRDRGARGDEHRREHDGTIRRVARNVKTSVLVVVDSFFHVICPR
jgi:hypothetical protein